MSWLERVEDIIHVLEGSAISELELTEAGTEIIIRRRTHLVTVSTPTGQQPTQAAQVEEIIAPCTGVYYEAPSPTSPPFVTVGDVVHVGQVIALIEAMKVFNEVQAEIAGRVVAKVATSGNVVRKGDVLLHIKPAQ